MFWHCVLLAFCLSGTHVAHCTLCAAGKYTNTIGIAACIDCPVGQSSNVGATVCTECPAGKYTSAPEHSVCDPAGVVPSRPTQSCLVKSDCNYAGCKAVPGIFGCWDSLCWRGTHDWNMRHCPSRPPCIDGCDFCRNNSMSATGSSSMTHCKCNAGSGSEDGLDCSICPAGKYKSTTGSGVCNSCLPGTVSEPGSDSVSDCLCPAGYTLSNNTTCTLCDTGKYKNAAGNDKCNTTTGTNYTTQPEKISCLLVGAFGHYRHDGICKKCTYLHVGYCKFLQQILLEDNFDFFFDINACHHFVASQNTVDLCNSCSCSISRNSIPYGPFNACNKTNHYVSSLTNDCEYCPPSYYIVRNHSGNWCVPFSTTAVGTDMYGKCVAGYFKVRSICTPCPKGTFSSFSSNRLCTMCPRNLTTKYEASIHQDDCALCSNNQFQVFVNATGYQCKQCDVCTTRREAAHMFSSCHKCQIQDIKFKDQVAKNCVLSQMGSCETYFETDDAVKSCANTPLPQNLECTAINLPRVYTTIYRHPLDFQFNAVGNEKLKVTSHKLNWEFTFELRDVQAYLTWIQFSNIVNQHYMLERNAKFANCLKAGGDDVLEVCSTADDEFTLEDPGLRISTRYLSIVKAHIDYYKNIPTILTVIPEIGHSLQNGCILPSTQRFNQVIVQITPVNIELKAVQRIIIQNSELLNTTCEGMCMSGSSVSINMAARDICNIYFEVNTDKKTNNVFSVRFNLLTSERTFFSVLLISNKIHSTTNFYFCSSSEFIQNAAYIKDNIEYDNLQKFVSAGMCTGKDYYIQ